MRPGAPPGGKGGREGEKLRQSEVHVGTVALLRALGATREVLAASHASLACGWASRELEPRSEDPASAEQGPRFGC